MSQKHELRKDGYFSFRILGNMWGYYNRDLARKIVIFFVLEKLPVECNNRYFTKIIRSNTYTSRIIHDSHSTSLFIRMYQNHLPTLLQVLFYKLQRFIYTFLVILRTVTCHAIRYSDRAVLNHNQYRSKQKVCSHQVRIYSWIII